MVNLDAFILSHTTEPVDFPDQALVDKFLPKYKPEHAYLRPEDPMTLGSFCPPEYIQEIRYQTDEHMHNARPVIKEVNRDYAQMFGRDYHGLIEEYRTDDADAILMTIGTVTSTSRAVVDELREKGKKVGLAKLRFFRPFPIEEIRELAKKTKALGVYDRSISFGIGGPAFIEVRHSLYGHSDIPVMNFLAGLGGRDVTIEDIKLMYDNLLEASQTKKLKKEILWIGTRGV
jgi:pyruvate/2-oxoacid:ferredoxin oxidoreductase alpha subunit